jgi:hypothetical protein
MAAGYLRSPRTRIKIIALVGKRSIDQQRKISDARHAGLQGPPNGEMEEFECAE